jgi:predicted lipase
VAYNPSDKEIIVAFRGSVNIANWVTNLDFLMKPYPGVSGAQVHRGFSEAFDAVSPLVVSSVQNLLSAHPNANIVITGHSLGAALATFAAVDLKTKLNIPSTRITFYTFGSPRTGNQAFTDYLYSLYPTSGCQRVTHYNDVVPHLPPTVLGFNHFGDEIWYKNAGTDLTYTTCKNQAGKQEDLSCSSSIYATGIEAHLIYLGKSFTGICKQPQAK